VQLLDNEGNNSFQRRFIRLIAATILLICLNILFFELNVSNLERFATDINSSQNFREIVLTIVAAQIGAIVTTFFLGFIVRRINTPLTASGFPKWIRYLLSTARITWHYLACLAVVGSAFYITLISLPSYRTNSITLELGPQEVRTDTVQLGALAITFFIALLLYYPPKYSGVRKKWWLLRVLGGIACLGGFILVYRSTSADLTETVLQAALVAATVAVSFVFVQQAVS
jgi:uncharacterized membrane protein YwzB